jgi:glucose-1-phosphate adenylyltransferase
MPGHPDTALASMGIYLFRADFLYEELAREAGNPHTSHDFGRDIIPRLVGGASDVMAHPLSRSAVYSEGQTEAYWRDVGTLDAYWEANIDLTYITPALDLYDSYWPIFTYQRQEPPAKFVHDSGHRRGFAVNSTVAGGCVISGGEVSQSLLSTGVRVNSFAKLSGAVVLEDVDIGRHAQLSNVIIDSRVRIPEGLVVGQDPAEDARRFERTEKGRVLITQPMIDALEP